MTVVSRPPRRTWLALTAGWILACVAWSIVAAGAIGYVLIAVCSGGAVFCWERVHRG